MKTQEVFDKVVAHLRQQNAKSLDSVSACMYRGIGGRKCAVGILLSDAEYVPDMEGKNSMQLVRFPSVLKETKQILWANEGVLSALQRAHDLYKIEEWESRFKIIASSYQLIYTPPMP